MSRNAQILLEKIARRLLPLTLVTCLCAPVLAADASRNGSNATTRSRVVIAHDPEATEAFKPQPEKIRQMVRLGITRLTGKSDETKAWQSLVSPKDLLGIKVFSSPGADAGTRIAVVSAVVEGLLKAKIPAGNIIVWDRQESDLQRAGFGDLAKRHGIRVEGAVDAGFDERTFYSPERPILGQLVWGDLEFGRKTEGVGRRSFVSTLVSKGLTKIINITPMLNHNSAGVTGHLYSLAMGSTDNNLRFENDLARLSTAVPELYALPSLGDRVVLNITDALICQYQGEQRGLLHYSTTLNELRFSKDPVALDYLSLRDLDRVRQASRIAVSQTQSLTNQMELLYNASLLELGTSDPGAIKTERVP